MSQRQLPKIPLDPTLRSPGPETMGQFLSREVFADLYRLAAEEGLPCFPRIDAAGHVEICLVFESVEAFCAEAQDALSIDWKTHEDKLLAIVWTRTDPRHPLGFPLTFRIGEERQRYMAMQMVLQPLVPVHHLALLNGQLLHIYSESLSFSTADRQQVLGMVEQLEKDACGLEQPFATPDAGHIGEAALMSMAGEQLDDLLLLQSGLAYLFDYTTMERQHGAEAAQEQLMIALHKALLVMRRHPRSEVRGQSFTVWVAKLPPQLALVITPSLSDLFAAADSSCAAEDPFSHIFATLPHFAGTHEIQPLAVGSYPLIRAEQGRLLHLELTEALQRRLERLFAANWPGEANPYTAT